MPTQGASTIVLSDDRKSVLLIKREDLRLWAVPGGGIEAGESCEEAAIREAREETGYEIALDRFIGRYWHPQTPHGGDWQHVFQAHIVGGAAIASGPETAAVRFFPVDHLPRFMVPWARVHVRDALANLPSPIERIEYLPIMMMLLFRLGQRLYRWRTRWTASRS